MPTLTTSDIVRAVPGARRLGPEATAKWILADSRAITQDAAFAAINTGNAYVADVIRAGAPFVITSDASSVPDGASAVVVEDMQSALIALARDVVRRLQPRVVGITGSVGKTLTKDLIAAALGTRYRVHRTPRSFNAEIGVPLTVLCAPDDVEVLVLEMGARGVGQIAELCGIARPQTGVITTIGTTHIELFKTREAIARTKSELLASLPADGAAIIPSNDDFLATMVASTEARAVTVGPGGHVRYAATEITGDGKTRGTVSVGGETADVTLPFLGRSLMRNGAFAVAVAVEHGISLGDAAEVLERADVSRNRMALVQIDKWDVVNDTYNANPISVASALRTTKELAKVRGSTGELWAVLGEMAELGDEAPAAHARIGRMAAALGYRLIVIGEAAAPIADAAPGAIRVASADASREAIRANIPPGSTILVKASRAVALEHVVERLMSEQAG